MYIKITISYIGLLDKKNKFGIQDYLKVIHEGKSNFIFDDLMDNINEIYRLNTALRLGEDNEALETAIKTAELWYKSIIPEYSMTCPKNIEETHEYQYADIDDILHKAMLLAIDPEKEPYLLWIPRILCSMKLPPFWRSNPIYDNLWYYNVEHDVISTDHPGLNFFKIYTKKIRKMFKNKQLPPSKYIKK